MPSRDVAAIIVAAGSGNRFGGPKQFEGLGDLPIYQYVVRTFSLIAPIHTVVLVGREEDVERYREGLHSLNPPANWVVVTGGESRQESVANGLAAISKVPDIGIVLVHDVARALVDDIVILSVIGACREFGSAIAGVPVVDTLKRVLDNEIVETQSRQNLWRAQTPQGARLPLLIAAHEQARVASYEGTDESELLERIGEKPHIVRGTELNFKITYPEDLERARRIVAYKTQFRRTS